MRGHIIFLFSLIAVKSLMLSQQSAIFNNPTFAGGTPNSKKASSYFRKIEGIVIVHTPDHFLVVNDGHISFIYGSVFI